MRLAATITILSACVLMAGCSGGEKTGNTVQMKDLEVVDGTTSDAMTDLDGVQSEGTAAVLPANDGSGAGSPKAGSAPRTETNESSEVLADQ